MSTQLAKISSLDTATPVGLNLSATYWSPVNIGETKRLYFIELKPMNHTNEETGESKTLTTAIFVDPTTKEVIHQGSARLVGIFERELPAPLTPFQITYKGKVKNSTNAYSSDAWEVYQLKIEAPKA